MSSGNTPPSASGNLPTSPAHYAEETAELNSLKRHSSNPKNTELRFENGHFKAGRKSKKKAWALRTVYPLARVIPTLGKKVESALKDIAHENDRQTEAAVDHLEEMAKFVKSDKALATRKICTVDNAVNYLRETYSEYADPETWHFPAYADYSTLTFLDTKSYHDKKADYLQQLQKNLRLAYRVVNDATAIQEKLTKETSAAAKTDGQIKDYYRDMNKEFKMLSSKELSALQDDSGKTAVADWTDKSEQLQQRSVDFQTLPGRQKAGLAHSEGRRKGMEDADLHTTVRVKTRKGAVNIDISGVFDGHGGAGASKHAKEHLISHLKKRLEHGNPESLTDKQVWNALKLAFVDTSNTYTGDDGTTANVALMINGNLWVANLGDSRAIMVKPTGITEQLSEDASPGDDKYRRGVEKRGQRVQNGRVGGLFNNVAVARSMGDHVFHGAINARPKITMYPKPEEGWAGHTLVQCCDGVFDVATSEDVGSFVYRRKKAGDSNAVIAGRLVEQAYNSGSGDNLTAMVTPLGD